MRGGLPFGGEERPGFGLEPVVDGRADQDADRVMGQLG